MVQTDVGRLIGDFERSPGKRGFFVDWSSGASEYRQISIGISASSAVCTMPWTCSWLWIMLVAAFLGRCKA